MAIKKVIKHFRNMQKASKKLYKRKKTKRNRGKGPGCNKIPHKPITSLGVYFNTLNYNLKKGHTFWFRGNADLEHDLTPSALRKDKKKEIDKALDLLGNFKRLTELKLQKIPANNEEFKWVQLAQHYGLPTRLLDWTKNAAIALYFACEKDFEKDGAVFIINPIDLNRQVDPKNIRVYDPNQDSKLITKYLNLKSAQNKKSGLKTIAVEPTWNSERIIVQQGVFTLHGSKFFTLTSQEASSLVYLEIKKEHKETLLDELERAGINEMSVFPEVEHTCRYLKRKAKLVE